MVVSNNSNKNPIWVRDLDEDSITIVDYNGQAETYSMSQELRVDEDNYRQEFIQQAPKYSYWMNALQQAKLVQADHDNRLTKLRGELYIKYRAQLEAEGKKPPAVMIEAAIGSDKDYLDAKAQLDYANFNVGRVQGLVKAFEQRAQMLISYGADQRADQRNGN